MPGERRGRERDVMISRKQLELTLGRHGFSYVEEPGFQSFHRVHRDGDDQYVRFFTWSNKAHAEKREFRGPIWWWCCVRGGFGCLWCSGLLVSRRGFRLVRCSMSWRGFF